MAKANNTEIYKYDTNISMLDYLFGSDVNDFKRNKSYRIKDLIGLVNNINTIAGIEYIFSEGINPEIDYFSNGFMFTDNNETNISNYTKLIFNKKTLSDINLSLLFDFFSNVENLNLRLTNIKDPNNFLNVKVTGIASFIDYFAVDVSLINNSYIGEFQDGLVYRLTWDISVMDQNNKIKPIYIQLPEALSLGDDVSTYFNNLATFTVSEKEIPLVVTTQSVTTGGGNEYIEVKKYCLKNKGKGTYGVGKPPLTISEFEIVYSELATVANIIDLPTTQTLDLGNITGSTVSDAVNTLVTSINVQNQGAGYRIFKTIEEGIEKNYLFVAAGGLYGASNLQTTDVDFQLFESSDSPIVKATTSTSGTVKTETDEIDPVVYVKERVDELFVVKVTGKSLLLDTEIARLAAMANDVDAPVSGPQATAISNAETNAKNYADGLFVVKVIGKQLSDENYTLLEKNKLASITAIFTSALKSAYDGAVTWIAVNGTNLINHLSSTSNPHGTTASQVGAPTGSGTSTGTNTGDNAVNNLYSGLAASKEDTSNKSTSVSDVASSVRFPVWSAVVTYVSGVLGTFKTANFLDFTSSGQTQINSKQDKTEIRTSSFTAVNGKRYTVTATATITNPTGVSNEGYDFEVLAGTTTLGGQTYGVGSVVQVRFQSGAFSYYHFADNNDLIITTATNISTDVSWRARVVKIIASANITVTVNHSFTCVGIKESTFDVQFINGAQTINAINGTATMAGNIGCRFGLSKREAATNGMNLFIVNV